jgi:hypothetical protein
MKIRYISFCALSLLVIAPSCKKYLAASPSASLTIPNTVADLQSILDYSNYMNDICSVAGEIAADNYYLPDAEYNALPHSQDRLAYLWDPGQFTGISPDDWDNEYTVVYNANVVLDGLGGIQRTEANASSIDLCKGIALAFRARSFYEIAQVFAKGYDSATANTDLGIPLRLTSDFNAPSKRSSVAQTYQQILGDLNGAIQLLPTVPPSFQYRPYKGSAFGLLARTYLAMGAYPQALAAADSALSYNNTLLDYNTLNPNGAFPFTAFRYTNPEDMLHTIAIVTNFDIQYTYARVDSTLYQSYDSNDLRQTVFFGALADGTHRFKGSYHGNSQLYTGLATDELYLIKAECEARAGDITNSMLDLNTLLVKRWVTGTFVPYTAPDATTALNLVLQERRKELLFRMLRFTDLKRLNVEGYNITVTRVTGGQTYTLPPNDPRYAIQIPEDVIAATGMPQN